MLSNGVLIGQELREFDRMCVMGMESHFGISQSCEVLTFDR